MFEFYRKQYKLLKRISKNAQYLKKYKFLRYFKNFWLFMIQKDLWEIHDRYYRDSVNEQDLYKDFKRKYKNKVIIPFFDFSVGTACSLNCRNCTQWIPYLEKKAKEYLDKLYDLLPSAKRLVLVHPLIISGRFDHQLPLFEKTDKIIRIKRNPLDCYVDTCLKTTDQNTLFPAENFLKNYLSKFHYEEENKNAGNPVLDITFEDFCLSYDETEQKILSFLDIDKSLHKQRKQMANPEISRKNIGIYKDWPNKEEINYLKQQVAFNI